MVKLATIFELKPPVTVTEKGNQVLARQFNLDRWLDAKDPYCFSNAKCITLQCGRLRTYNDPEQDVSHAELARIEHSLPLDCWRVLDRQIDFHFCIDIENGPGLVTELRLPLHDMRAAREQTKVTLEGRRAALEVLVLEGWERAGKTSLWERRSKIWQRMYHSDKMVMGILGVMFEGIAKVWKLGKDGTLPRHSMKTAQEQLLSRYKERYGDVNRYSRR